MTIYIETFLIQNILINFCLLKLVHTTTHTKTTIFRLILASSVGAGFSVVSAIFFTNNMLLNINKFVCAISIILITFKQTKKQFIFNFILLFIYTYALFGCVVTLNSSIYYTSFGAIISSKFSIEAICAICIVVTYIFEFVSKHLKQRLKLSNLIYNINLENNGTQLSISAFLDTGNLLTYKNQSVIIVDIQSFLKLANVNLLEFYTKKFETISTSTVTNTKNLKAIKIDKIEIKHKRKTISLTNQYIATDSNNSFKDLNYQALISPQMF